MKTASFYSPGKLLLSGEYLVLRGAEAIAAPTRYGQHLTVESAEAGLHWRALDHQGQIWFERFYTPDLNPARATEEVDLDRILHVISKKIKSAPTALRMTSKLDFPRDWGLGSSSTLIALLAEAFEVEALPLFFESLTGSGYDVAVALEKTPIRYRLLDGQATYSPVRLPEVLKNSYFIHSKVKQKSEIEVKRFEQRQVSEADLSAVSNLSSDLLQLHSQEALMQWMQSHEELIAKLIGREPIGQSHFSDFKGSVKSLGAWGGDFIWATGENVPEYFAEKGYDLCFTFDELLLLN